MTQPVRAVRAGRRSEQDPARAALDSGHAGGTRTGLALVEDRVEHAEGRSVNRSALIARPTDRVISV
jgi:hypothetical protein